MQPYSARTQGTSPGSPGYTLDPNNQRSYYQGSSSQRQTNDVELQKRLDQEFEDARNQVNLSESAIKRQQLELTSEAAKNLALRQKLYGQDISPDVSKFGADINSENQQLEMRLRELEADISATRQQSQGIRGNTKLSTKGDTLSNRYSQLEEANFLHKNEAAELRHLNNMLKIFNEENSRLKEIYSRGQKPSEADVIYIKSNIDKVKREIEEILRSRAMLNQRFTEQVTIIDRLQNENNSLKNHNNRQVDSSQIQDLIKELNSRNSKILELNTELNMLRNAMSTERPPASTSIEIINLKRELDIRNNKIRDLERSLTTQTQNCNSLMQSNQNMSGQLFDLKRQLDSIDTGHIRSELTSNRKAIDMLTRENDGLRKEVARSSARNERDTQETVPRGVGEKEGKEGESSALVSPSRNLVTIKKRIGDDIDEELMKERPTMGEVSYDEILKLEDKIKEFGEYNQDLEGLIYKLKSKITGTEYEPHERTNQANYDSNRSDRIPSSKVTEKLQKMVHDLTIKVDTLVQSTPKVNSSPNVPDLISHIEQIIVNTKRREEGDMKLLYIQRNYQQVSDDLSELKDKYRELEIKYNTLVSVNIQNEAHIDKLIAQIQDNKQYFKKLISENEGLKVKEREAAEELGTWVKQNSELNEFNNDLNRQKTAM